MQKNSRSRTIKLAGGSLLLAGAAAITYSVKCSAEIAVAIGPNLFWGGIAATVLACVLFAATTRTE